MKEIKIEELKAIQVNILKNVDAFCKEHNINYFLAYGSLLGAVRHKGYIPWDDDIDIIMLREDYDRFLSEFPHGESSEYNVRAGDYGNFPYTYAKIEDSRTIMVETTNYIDELGVNIDLFPYDNIPDDKELGNAFIKRISHLNMIYGLKRTKLTAHRSFLKNCALLICHMALFFISNKRLIRRIIKESQRYKSQSTNYCGNLCMNHYGFKEYHPKSLFCKATEVSFEGYSFRSPADYDAYLTSIYGDYMKLPPEEKQVTHHSFNAYWKV